jgi:inorganic pyrophosphatase
MMECRLVGAIKAQQGKKDKEKIENDRYIAVPVVSVVHRDLMRLDNAPELIKEIGDFFRNYNKAEDKVFEVTGFLSAKEAFKKIKSKIR